MTPTISPNSARRRSHDGFTLTEMLIVIGIIVLVVAIAVPSFRALTGGKSTEAAHNQLSAILGRARMDAMGVQETRGIMFFRDPESQRVGAVFVRAVPPPVDATPVAVGQRAPEVYLDLVPDRDPQLLPVGVGLQVLDDTAGAAAGTRDRYIGMNTAGSDSPNTLGPTAVPYGGVILFDGLGRLVSLPYALRIHVDPNGAAATPPGGTPTEMGRFLYADLNMAGVSAAAQQSLVQSPTPRSQFGFVVYDQDGFASQEFTDTDPQVMNTPFVIGEVEDNEEKWLDNNATPQLVNRYNGTLLRGE
jgi:prepilin-type N-terminal cleavage/methylation domain-containing protein